MRKSLKREKELDRSFDFAEAAGFRRASDNVGFVKRRANRRVRHNAKRELKKLEISL